MEGEPQLPSRPRFAPPAGALCAEVASAQAPAVHQGRARPFIVAVGGGKGGIGKSLISANLAVLLGSQGHKVTLFDADLGGANAHTCLGLAAPPLSVADFLRREAEHLVDVAAETPYENVRLISGALDWLQAANPKPAEKARLGEALLTMPGDIVVIDLGAGTSLHTIDFFLLADRGVVALIPEPTAIENAYRFMKMACIRRLQAIELSWAARPLVTRVLNEPTTRGLKSPAELLRDIRSYDPSLAAQLKHQLEQRPFALVVNQVRTEQEGQLAAAIRQASRRYFGVTIDEAISLPYAEAAWQAVRRRRPVVNDEPEGALATGLSELCRLVERGL